MEVIKVSAKQDRNVDLIFEKLIKNILAGEQKFLETSQYSEQINVDLDLYKKYSHLETPINDVQERKISRKGLRLTEPVLS